MKRHEAIKTIAAVLKGNELVVTANGMISREMCAIKDEPNNFYMLGSMGLSSSIGLGLALSLPNKTIIVIDGDGNILMNMGSLATIGNLAPKNLIHIVLDNESHDSTGGQPTASRTIKLEKVAEASEFKITQKIYDVKTLEKAMKQVLSSSGPSFILVKIKRRGEEVPRVPYEMETIKTRFMNSIQLC
jgi:sulfopyruvate decarboxylase subunit beta